MLNDKASTKQKTRPQHAQAMVEFAIALPVLMLVLVGIFEAARMIFIYGAMTTAAREASRYASAVGLADGSTTVLKYNDCQGIIEAARRAAFFAPITAEVSYDRGPGDTPLVYCIGSASGGTVTVSAFSSISLESNDRVNVHVWTNYAPMLRLIPFRPRTFEATSSRTILGIFELGIGTSTSTPMGGGPAATATVTRAVTSTSTTTPLPTGTSTITSTPGAVFTLTSQSSPTITLLPGNTATPTNTLLPTATMTASRTPTASATSQSTAVPGCGSLSATGLIMFTNSKTITLTITNPHDNITLASIQLVWNAATGASGNQLLTWQSATVANQTWTSINNSSGNYTSVPGSTITIPGYNTTSAVIITFDKNYQNPIAGGTSVTLNFATAGCSSITRTQ